MAEARAKEAILGDIEALMGEYLTSGTSEPGAQVMVTGYVFKVTGRAFHEGQVERRHGWATPEEQDTHMTLGLAQGLAREVGNWYDAVTDYDEDDDEDDD